MWFGNATAVFVLTLSARENAHRRERVRLAWRAQAQPDVGAAFFVGNYSCGFQDLYARCRSGYEGQDAEQQREILQERRQWDDLVLLPLVDVYRHHVRKLKLARADPRARARAVDLQVRRQLLSASRLCRDGSTSASATDRRPLSGRSTPTSAATRRRPAKHRAPRRGGQRTVMPPGRLIGRVRDARRGRVCGGAQRRRIAGRGRRWGCGSTSGRSGRCCACSTRRRSSSTAPGCRASTCKGAGRGPRRNGSQECAAAPGEFARPG